MCSLPGTRSYTLVAIITFVNAEAKEMVARGALFIITYIAGKCCFSFGRSEHVQSMWGVLSVLI